MESKQSYIYRKNLHLLAFTSVNTDPSITHQCSLYLRRAKNYLVKKGFEGHVHDQIESVLALKQIIDQIVEQDLPKSGPDSSKNILVVYYSGQGVWNEKQNQRVVIEIGGDSVDLSAVMGKYSGKKIAKIVTIEDVLVRQMEGAQLDMAPMRVWEKTVQKGFECIHLQMITQKVDEKFH